MAVLIAGSLAGIAYGWMTAPREAEQAVITVDGKVFRTVRLGGYERIYVPGTGGYDIVEIDGRRVRVVDADCPDKLCIKTGWISRPPEQIVCLPNRVVVKITGGQAADVDAIVR